MISVTQKQKEILNAYGVEVIEFKQAAMKVQEIFDDIVKCVKRLAESMKPIIEAIKEYLESKMVSAMDKYRICKSLGTDYQPYIKRNHIYRCLNNC